jgi:hypothetical protein
MIEPGKQRLSDRRVDLVFDAGDDGPPGASSGNQAVSSSMSEEPVGKGLALV